MPTKIKPSRDRAVAPLENSWLRGETKTVVHFTPEPCYHHGRFCECQVCEFRNADNFEPVPDFDFPQTMRYETPENERRRRTNLLLKWAVLLTWAAAYVVIAVIVGTMK